MANRTTGVCLAISGVVAAICAVMVVRNWTGAGDGKERADDGGRAPRSAVIGEAADVRKGVVGDVVGKTEGPEAAASEQETEEVISEDERREREEESLVDAFDALTDKWMEAVEGGVTMEDVDEFSARFRKVPDAQKEDCLRRALNLVPDENVMLLAGILMDKSQPKELVELVYNDVLNRDEDVKRPILLQIYKDKTHPCWKDTAWIMDVTGELSGGK